MEKSINWVFFAANAKPTSMRRAIADRLAEKEPVVTIESPVSVLRTGKLPSLSARFGCRAGFEAYGNYQPLHYPTGFPGIGKILKLVNRRVLQRELDQLLRQGAKRIICYDSPTQADLVKKLNDHMSIYLAVDDLTLTVSGTPIEGEEMAEVSILDKVDEVICVSETLAKTLKSRMPAGRILPVNVLPNGFDERVFDPERGWKEPFVLRNVSRPRILVAGHVSERIDWHGIMGTVQKRPKWTWIFVGPAEHGMIEKIQCNLGGLGYYHPPIPSTDIPAWIHHCEVCAVPYRLNSFTCASNPLKAIEYLAMGAPVLSTEVPSLKRYEGAIEWVNEGNSASYAKALDKLEKQYGNHELGVFRRRAVAEDSWERRKSQFQQIVYRYECRAKDRKREGEA